MKNIKETCKSILAKIKKLESELEKQSEALAALREICEHDYEYDGHDSHHNYEKCRICGKVESD